MMVSKLQGGLGNQLFQYAHGKALSLLNKESFYVDISWYKGRIDRQYMLGYFNIKVKTSNNLFNYVKIIYTKYFNKKKFLIGDWQNEKYFKSIEEVIGNEFTLKDKISVESEGVLNEINKQTSISIHLRGGDYVRGKKSSFHGVCSPEYYRDAIDYMRRNTNSPHFFIFTDDIDWARKHIEFPVPHTIVSTMISRPEEELILMSKCDHAIIANSTFSWWGAWLINSKNKIVIGPKKWFADEKNNISDILPSSWIQI